MTQPAKYAAILKSPWAMLLMALALAAGVAFLAYAYLQQREARIKEEVAAKSSKTQAPRVAVAVPIMDATVGVVIDKSRFSARQVEEDLVYPDTVLARDFEALEGQKLARPVLRGRPLRLTDIQAPEVRDVASVLPAGSRALTIDIDNVNSIAQTLRPGHYVDIFLINKATKTGDAAVPEEALQQAALFMQNMQVLATGQEFRDLRNGETQDGMVRPGDVEGRDKRDFDTLTLLVSPAQAAKLLVGQKMGSYRIALRGAKDDRPVALATLRAGDLMPGRAGRDAGVEFIVGGKGGGETAIQIRPSRTPAGPDAGSATQARDTASARIGEMEAMLRRVGTPRRGQEAQPDTATGTSR